MIKVGDIVKKRGEISLNTRRVRKIKTTSGGDYAYFYGGGYYRADKLRKVSK